MLSAPHWIPGSNRADRGRLAARFRAGGWRQLELRGCGKVWNDETSSCSQYSLGVYLKCSVLVITFKLRHHLMACSGVW